MNSKIYKIFAFYTALILFISSSPIIHATEVVPNEKTVDSLLLVSYQKFLEIKIEEDIKTSNEALTISNKINYSKGKAKSYFYLARSFSYLGEYDKALDYLHRCEKEQYTQNQPDIRSEMHRIRGHIFNYIGLAKKSINEFKNELHFAQKIAEEPRRLQFTSLAYENLSIAYGTVQNDDSMFYYLKKNEEILSSKEFPNNSYNKLNLYTMYGDYYSAKDDYLLADSFFNKAIHMAETNQLKYVSWIYKHWGDMELKRNKVNQALAYYLQALENVKETNMRNELQPIYRQIGKVYEMKGMVDSMKVYENEAIRIENEQLNERQKTIENALNIIVEEEKNKQATVFQSKTMLFIYIGCGILVGTLTFGLFWRARHRQKIAEIEKEVESLEARLRTNTQELIELAKANDPAFISRFMESFPKFTKNIYEKHPDLISSEFWFCAMLFLDFSSKEIAQYSFIEHRSVQIRKNRLRKKLKIDSEVDLYQYIKSFRSDEQ